MVDIVQNTDLLDETVSERASAPEEVQLKVELTSTINYALQQNRIPIIREFLILNNSADDIENAVVSVRCEPELVCAAQMNVALIPAGSSFELNGFRPQVNASLLADLTERIVGQLYVALENDRGETLAKHHCEIIALAFDEWHGTAFYPELLSAFVTPNHPEVTKITARAAQLLGGWSGDPSLGRFLTYCQGFVPAC